MAQHTEESLSSMTVADLRATAVSVLGHEEAAKVFLESDEARKPIEKAILEEQLRQQGTQDNQQAQP